MVTTKVGMSKSTSLSYITIQIRVTDLSCIRVPATICPFDSQNRPTPNSTITRAGSSH